MYQKQYEILKKNKDALKNKYKNFNSWTLLKLHLAHSAAI